MQTKTLELLISVKQFRQRLQFLGIIVTVLVSSACASPTKTEILVHKTISLDPGETIVLFPNRSPTAPSTARNFMQCVKKELAEHSIPLTQIANTIEFQNALFPWFEPDHAPHTAEEMDSLLSKPEIKERIEALKIRYLVSVALSETRDGFPGMLWELRGDKPVNQCGQGEPERWSMPGKGGQTIRPG